MTSESRILLVDDDPIMCELAQSKLAEAGYQVSVAENGARALERLRRDGADLVISDLEMPVMDGFELTEVIRADPELRETPVIVITASDHADAVEKAFAAGATSFLAKPMNWTLFSQAVMFVLRADNDQKALRAARDEAEAGARFKDGLMSVMSHELRTPLNAIIGFGQLLGEQFRQRNDHLHREYADYIVDGGKRLLNTVSDMLLASDACSGPIAISETDATVGEILETAKAFVSSTVAAAGADMKLKIQDKNLEVCCDRQLIGRALAKLIENAVKFSPRGVKIVIGAARTKKGDLAIMVKDDGPGIEPQKLKDILSPFAQTDLSLRRSKEGLGLGLPLTQAIAAAHGAVFRIDSRPGEGARALLVLPAARVRARPACASRSAA